MLGLTGYSDLRDIESCKEEEMRCQLALDMNAYRIKKFIGSYTAVMNVWTPLFSLQEWGKSIIRRLVLYRYGVFRIRNWMMPRMRFDRSKETEK
jgi:acetate kinase